ncbi:MAG: flagellar protein FliS [Gammaproteobacteria bacterium]|jgi:flagellar protein FliS
MGISVTRAAIEMEERSEDISPYQVIKLLLDGAMERVNQAKLTLAEGKTEEAGELMARVVGIINGLRGSLDFEKGGEVAVTLDNLYEYINIRLCEAEAEDGQDVLVETEKLLGEVKAGWDGIAA